MKTNEKNVTVNTGEQDYMTFKSKLLTTVLTVGVVLTALFGALHSLGIATTTDFHAIVDYVQAAIFLFILIWIKKFNYHLTIVLRIVILTALITSTSALISVPDDQFRMIWFFLLTLVAFMLGDTVTGIATTVLSLVLIFLMDGMGLIQLSDISRTSIALGLLSLAYMTYVFSKRTREYAALITAKNRQLQLMATEDPLTGIKNARYHYEEGARIFDIAKRGQHDLGLMFLDLDHFKEINDSYGHKAGDEVLIQFAKHLKSITRKSDTCSRIGGEEFCVLLPDTDADEVQRIAQKVRKSIEDQKISVQGNMLAITVSIGTSARQSSDTSLEDIQERADKAVYLAKSAGRNKVIFI